MVLPGSTSFKKVACVEQKKAAGLGRAEIPALVGMMLMVITNSTGFWQGPWRGKILMEEGRAGGVGSNSRWRSIGIVSMNSGRGFKEAYVREGWSELENIRGRLGGSAVECLPSTQGVILETQDQVPHEDPCMKPASPSACVSASLCVSHEQINKIFFKRSLLGSPGGSAI